MKQRIYFIWIGKIPQSMMSATTSRHKLTVLVFILIFFSISNPSVHLCPFFVYFLHTHTQNAHVWIVFRCGLFFVVVLIHIHDLFLGINIKLKIAQKRIKTDFNSHKMSSYFYPYTQAQCNLHSYICSPFHFGHVIWTQSIETFDRIEVKIWNSLILMLARQLIWI